MSSSDEPKHEDDPHYNNPKRDNVLLDKQNNMLDICFDRVTREGDISPIQRRSESNKSKKKTHERQHSWDGKVSEKFFQDIYRCDWQSKIICLYQQPQQDPINLEKNDELSSVVGYV